MGALQILGFVGPSVNWWALLPQIILLGAALAILLASALAPQRTTTAFVTVTTLCSAVTSSIVAIGLLAHGIAAFETAYLPKCLGYQDSSTRSRDKPGHQR